MRFRPVFEQLESRRLLSAQPVAAVASPTYIRFTPSGPKPAESGSSTPVGLTPAQIRAAYGFNQVTFSNGAIVGNGAGETIAIIDVYNDPNITGDLHSFDQAFGLADPPSFSIINENGGSTLPGTDPSGTQGAGDNDWELETSLDVEWAHALAPAAKILLVEASSAGNSDLDAAIAYAKSVSGVVAVSMSFSGPEAANEANTDASTFAQPGGSRGVTFLAATGDSGEPSGYPAYSPDVVAVGGTTLTTDAAGDYLGEVGWSDSGGGISAYESQPAYQTGVVTQSTTNRTVPDVSFDADPGTGVAIYDSYDFGASTPWIVVGGTSVATPSWAALIAVTDQGRAADGLNSLTSTQTLTDLYQMSSGTYNSTTQTKPATDFIDITSGNNGHGNSLYNAGPGYDLVTGLGSPNVPYMVNDFIGTFVVISSTPARGAVVGTPPTSFTVNFSDPFSASGLAPSDFQVNGIAASSLVQTSSTSITFDFTTSPVTAFGPQTMSIAAGALVETSGTPLAAYSATFIYDTQPTIAVTSTTPANGAVVPGPSTTLAVQFNEAYAPGSIGTSNLTFSEGTVTAAVQTNSTTVTYTISGLTSNAIVTYSIAAGAITDIYDAPGSAYSGTFTVEAPPQPFPTPLTAVGPAGSLVYQGSVSSAINFAGDADSYTLALAAGQTVSLLLTPASGLQGQVSISGPGGVSSSASSATAGETALLQSVAIGTAGTYTITVSGLASTTGGYTVALYLNAALSTAANGGASIGSLSGAQNINGSFESLPGGAQRGAVLGTLASSIGADGFGYDALSVAPQFVDISSTGTPFLQGVDDGYTAVTASPSTPFSFDFYGTTYSTFYVDSNGFISLTSLAGVRTSETYDNTNLTSNGTLSNPVIAPLWDDLVVKGQTNSAVYVETLGSGASEQLVVQWNDVSYYHGNQTGLLTFEAILNANGTMFFNYKNLSGGNLNPQSTAPTVGIKGQGSQSTGGDVLLVSYNSTTSPYVANNSSVEIGVGLAPADYYSFSATAGQTVTLAAASRSGGAVQLTLENASGTALASSTAPGTDVNAAIENFAIGTTGTYYVAVGGASGTSYNLVVTSGADFDTKTGTSQSKTQNISGTDGVLGSIQTATPQDWYSINLAAGSSLALQISTLGSTTAQFVDTLNPQIQLYSPSGVLLATQTSSHAINQVAAVPGNYTVEVTGVSGSIGEYFLSQVVTAAPPQIAAVYVSGGTAWSTAFYQYLSTAGLGGSLGYSLPGGKNQLQILPWDNLTTVSVVFTQNVTVNTAQAGLALVGSPDLPAVPSLGAATFSYNSSTDTATWTFASPLTTDKYLLCIPSDGVTNSSGVALAGSWTNTVGSTAGSSFPSGNGAPGGDFDFRFNVVPGDVNGDGVVTGLDGTAIRLNTGETTASPGYSPYDDVNGDGTITSTDMAAVRAALLQRLPATEPTAPQHDVALPGAALPAGNGPAVAKTGTGASNSASPPVGNSPVSTPAVRKQVKVLATVVTPKSATPARPPDSAPHSAIGSPSKELVANAAPKSAASSAPAAHSNPPMGKAAVASAAIQPASILAAASVNPLGGGSTPSSAATKAADDPATAIRDALFEHLDRIASRKSSRAL